MEQLSQLRSKLRRAIRVSWNFTVKPVAAEGFGAAAEAALEEATVNIEQYNPDGLDQAAAAVRLVAALVEAGVVGSGLVSAELSGHGNPGHAPQPGYAHDQIRITLTCGEPYPPAGVGA